MIADKAYAYDLSVPELQPDYMPSKKDFRVIRNNKRQEISKTPKAKPAKNTKLSLILSVVAIFTMCITVSYRYNIISEKNLELQRLKIEQTSVNSELATAEVALDRIIDTDTVEAYAKQQLGMQKPEKNQMIYINSKYETKVEEIANKNIFEKGLDKLKNLIGIE